MRTLARFLLAAGLAAGLFTAAPRAAFAEDADAYYKQGLAYKQENKPDQAIEVRFQAKTPGPSLHLQPVNMRFNYSESFEASRGTGYEVLLYNCMIGDATLFSRTDLVETAWRIAQPIMDAWTAHKATAYPNYAAGTWGPKAASDLIESDGRRWYEVINREVLDRVPLFKGADPVFLNQISMALRPQAAAAGGVV